MELVKTMRIVARYMPLPFYTLLVVVPGIVAGILCLADYVLPDDGCIWANVYTVAMFVLLGFINVCFWMKLHYQRLNDHSKAKKWMVAPTWFAVAILLAAMFAK